MLDLRETEVISRDALYSATETSSEHQQRQGQSRDQAKASPTALDWSTLLGYDISFSPPPSPSPSPSKQDQHSSRSRSTSPADKQDRTSNTTKISEVEEVEFRLFASDTVQKYILPASTPLVPLEALLKAEFGDGPVIANFTEEDVKKSREIHRPEEYYLTPPLDDDIQRSIRVEEVAVSGEHVLNVSSVRWRGCEVPWRVVHLTLAKDGKGISRNNGTRISIKKGTSSIIDGTSNKLSLGIIAVNKEVEEKERMKRHRPNKKRRIIIRKRKIDDQKKAEQLVAAKAARERNKNKKKEAKYRSYVSYSSSSQTDRRRR